MSSKLDEDREIADLALSEGRETLNKQLDALSDIDTKAAKILRINAVLLGIIVSGMSVAVSNSVLRPNGELFNAYTGIGLALLLSSIAFSALTYAASDSVVGVSRSDVDTLVNGDHPGLPTKEGLAVAFGEWIEFNSETIDIDAFYFTSTTVSLLWSLSFLCLGFADAVSHPVGLPTLVGTVSILALFTYTSEWVSQFTRWLDLVQPIERVKDISGLTEKFFP